MSITSVVNDTVTSESVINALKPLPPTISNYSVGGLDDTALDPAGGQTVQINGTGFLAGATITFDGSAVAVVTYVNPNRLTFTSPAKTAGTYTIYVVNPDSGTAIFIPGIIYSVLPTWTTSAGSLGSYYETTSISNTVVASGDAPITYSLFSGSLPTGSTLYANGVITGTAPVDSSSTTYSFTIEAIDAQLQGSTRSFSLTINVDAVTWVSPANATTYTSAVDSAIANVTLSATDAAGYAVSYSANALPTGLSLSGANISGTPTVIADSSTLLTATAATTNRSATRTINWSITVANDIYFEYNTLLIPGASTTFVDDASTNNFAVSIFGDTKPNSFNPYTPGYYSNYITTGAYLTTPATVANSGFSTGDFTVEAWIYPTVAQSTTIVSSNYSYSTAAGNWAFYTTVGSANTVYFNAGTSSSPNANHASTATATIPLNQWTHIAYSRTSAVGYFFINGVQLGTSVADTSGYAGATGTLYVGRQADGTGYLTGYISNLRIVKGTGVYTASFTPSTTPLTAISGTSLLTCQSNRFIDNSSNTYTLTITGSPTINSFDPFTPNTSYSTYGSGYFDGTGDYLSIPSNSALQLPTGDFTIEAWIYLTGALGSYYFIFTQTGATNATSNWDFIVNGNASGQLRFEAFSGGTQIINLIGTSSVPVNAWTHVAVTRSGSTYTIWMNGISQGTASSASTVNSNAITTYIGENNNNTYYFPGYITDVRIVKGTAVYTTAFTPPASPLTAIANTSLLTLQNNQSVNNNVFLDNSTNNFLVTRFGNTTQGTFSPYGGNWSNFFNNGQSNYIQTTIQAMTADFTVECWVYITSLPNNGVIIGQTWELWVNTSNQVVYYTPASVRMTTSLTVSLNTWTHIALVRSSGIAKIYINGVADASTYTNSATVGSLETTYIGRDPGASGGYNGYISNLRIVNGTAVYTSTFTPSTTPLTAITNTSLLTCQSPRLIDNSINNFTITKNGDTSVQRFSPFNPSSVTPTSYSGYFDGTGDYLTLASSSTFQITGDFTIEAWVYATSVDGHENIMSQYQNSTNSFACGYNSTLGWYFNYANNAAEVTNYRAGTSPLNTWTHVAFVKSSTTMTVYVNGTALASTITVPNLPLLSSTLNIGIWAGSLGDAWNGYISNIRMVKGVAVYTGTFTVPTSPLTVTQSSGTNIAAITGTSTSLLTLQSTTFIDNSTNNFTIFAFGSPQPTQQNPFGFTSATTNGYTVSTIGGSGYFDGTGDYLQTPTNITLSLSTSDFTLECWAYISSNTANYPAIISNWADNTWAANKWTLHASHLDNVNKLSFYVYNINSVSAVLTSTSTITFNIWNHFVITRLGTALQMFVNGVLVSSATSSASLDAGSGNLIRIGASSADTNSWFNGFLSNARIVKGTALYTSNFVPPPAPLTAVQNTSLLTNMTGAGVYDAAMMNNLETIGDAKLSTAVSKFGGSSMSFDGTGDYLTSNSATTDLYAFGSGNFTIEMWLYLNSVSGTQVFYDQRPLAGGVYPTLYMSGSTLYYYTNAANRITGSTLSTSQWYHIAVSRSGTSTKLFVNGTQSGSTYTDTNVYLNAALRPFIGGDGTNLGTGGLNGYIDDLRVTKGYARYTSNFSVPTTAFPIY